MSSVLSLRKNSCESEKKPAMPAELIPTNPQNPASDAEPTNSPIPAPAPVTSGSAEPANTPTLSSDTENNIELPDKLKAATMDQPAPQTDTEHGITCENCKMLNPPDAVACKNCGTLLVRNDVTVRIGDTDQQSDLLRNRITGSAIATEDVITLIMDKAHLSVPIPDAVTIGRAKPNNTDGPDIDLTPYGAADKGVSRKHVRIKRKDMLFYITDLGSTNGTDLNGQRLLPNTERMLRSGDELKLGQLKVKLAF
jgi:hypothetical protein